MPEMTLRSPGGTIHFRDWLESKKQPPQLKAVVSGPRTTVAPTPTEEVFASGWPCPEIANKSSTLCASHAVPYLVTSFLPYTFCSPATTQNQSAGLASVRFQLEGTKDCSWIDELSFDALAIPIQDAWPTASCDAVNLESVSWVHPPVDRAIMQLPQRLLATRCFSHCPS